MACKPGTAGVMSAGTVKKIISRGGNLKEESIRFVDGPDMRRARGKKNKTEIAPGSSQL